MAFLTPSTPLPRPAHVARDQATTRTRLAPRAAMSISRRRALQLAFGALLANTTGVRHSGWPRSLPAPANALSMDEERVTKALSTLVEARARAKTLRVEVATTWRKTAAVDDAEATLRIAAIWLEPARILLAALPDLPARVDIGDRETVRTMAALLRGHLLELAAEAENRRSEGVVRELDEFVETVDEVLALSALKRFARE